MDSSDNDLQKFEILEWMLEKSKLLFKVVIVIKLGKPIMEKLSSVEIYR